MVAGIIAERVGALPSSLTFHLENVQHVGWQGIYGANFKRMNALAGFLTENCCGRCPSACFPGSFSG
jgi:ArsR family transcriptional regulator, arsenate/arsenite/antimonite-responsive transcriptional repressor